MTMLNTSIQQALLLYFLDVLPRTRFSRLLDELGSAAQIIHADSAALRALGLKDVQIAAIHGCMSDSTLQRQVEHAITWCEAEANRHILLKTDSLYPPLLREIHDPPPLLFVSGQAQALLLPQIAMIGSRRSSVDGMANAALFSQYLAGQHLSICSGMARGIDTCAHEGALAVDGVTVAVLGTGVDVVYPRSNRALAAKIIERGALVSELPLGSKAIASHFPKRNRIISGMSTGVIVIEAALKSGSLITARLAIEHNRELFAVPGSIRNPLSVGAHRLIQQGAQLIDSPEQVVEQLDSVLGGQISLLHEAGRKAVEQNAKEVMPPNLSAEAQEVIKAIGYDPMPLEIIVERSSLPLSRVQTHLLRLELDGYIHNHMGRYSLS
ncbi:MAG: DNA-processing protein DprA [Gammaproteobacteria bacterium]